MIEYIKMSKILKWLFERDLKKTHLLTISFLTFTLTVYTSSIIYFKNSSQFTISFSDLLIFTSPLFLFSTLIIMVLVQTIKSDKQITVVSVLLVVSILLWFQGNILMWNYGKMDGRIIIWDNYLINGVIDTIIWFTLIALTLYRPTSLYRLAPVIVAAFVGIQLFTMLVYGFNSSNARNIEAIKKIGIDESLKFSYSDDTNVILIVLDAIQGNIFDEIIKEDKNYKEMFQGFTYFKNATSGSNYTELAIPAILTGKLYNNKVPRSTYLENSYTGGSLPKVLKDNGYLVELYPWMGWGNDSIFFSEKIASNMKLTNQKSLYDQILSEKKNKGNPPLARFILVQESSSFFKTTDL